MNDSNPKVIVPLDFDDPIHALALADKLDPRACALKVGKEMFVVAGPEPVRWMIERGFNVFLDLKFHDIPNTVAQACAAATRLGVWMLNVHAAGGRAMLTAARQNVDRAAAERGGKAPLLIAVTVLTSLSDADLREQGLTESTAAQAVKMARMTADWTASSVPRWRRRRCGPRWDPNSRWSHRAFGSPIRRRTTRRGSSRRKPPSPTAPTISSSGGR